MNSTPETAFFLQGLENLCPVPHNEVFPVLRRVVKPIPGFFHTNRPDILPVYHSEAEKIGAKGFINKNIDLKNWYPPFPKYHRAQLFLTGKFRF